MVVVVVAGTTCVIVYLWRTQDCHEGHINTAAVKTKQKKLMKQEVELLTVYQKIRLTHIYPESKAAGGKYCDKNAPQGVAQLQGK